MIRVLSAAVVLLAILCMVEAFALVSLKGDLAVLQASERAFASAGRRMSDRGDEMRRATEWLQSFIEAPDGLARQGGLCSGGTLDSAAITEWLYDGYLKYRFDGETEEGARQRVVDAIRETPDWHEAHHP